MSVTERKPLSPSDKVNPCQLPGGRDGDSGPRVRKPLPQSPFTPESKEQLLTQTQELQIMGLPALEPSPMPTPSACHKLDVTKNNVPLQATPLRWRQPGSRHHNASHFLGNRESHLYLCSDPCIWSYHVIQGAIFSLPLPCIVGRMI